MRLEDITPLVITFNEAANIARTLDKLAWAKRIVIIDSGSTDETRNIIARYPQAEVIYHAFNDFADQCNFGLSQVTSDWVISLDADYELSDELISEFTLLAPSEDTAGYRLSFVYRIYGRSLHGTLYPSRSVLYRKKQARYVNEGHGHRVILSGTIGTLRGKIYHDDRKPLSRWFVSQQRYARAEAEHLLSDESRLRCADRIRRMAWPAPILIFFYTLLVKGCLFNGWPGWFYALQRTLAETMIALEIIDRRLKARLQVN